MYLYKKGIILSVILFFGFSCFSQQIPDKNIFKIESSFRNGEYDKANNLCDLLINKYHQNRISNKLLYSEALIYKIKTEFITNGRISHITPLETKYLEVLRQMDQDSLSYYIRGLARLGEVYAVFGFQKKGFQNIEKSKNLLNKYFSKETQSFIQRYEVGVLNALGYYNKAYALAQSQLNFEMNNLHEDYSFVIPEANCNMVGQYKKNQYTAVKRDFADYMNQLAIIKYNQGSYIEADSLLEAAFSWIKFNIDQKARDVSAFDNRLLLVKNFEKLDQDGRAYSLTYSKKSHGKDGMKQSTKRTYQGFSYYEESETYMDYEEYLARHYWSLTGLKVGVKAKADGYYAKHHSFYERMGLNRDNVNIVKAELMLSDKYIISRKYDLAKGIIDSVANRKLHQTTNDFTPDTHPFKRLILLKSIAINSELGMYAETQEQIEELEKLDKEILVENSPTYKRDMLFIARVKHQTLDLYRESMAIYENYFFHDIENELHPLHKEHRDFTDEYLNLLILTGQLKKAAELMNTPIANAVKYKEYNTNNYAYQLTKHADLLLKSDNYKEADSLLEKSKKNGPIFSVVGKPSFKNKETIDEYYRVLTRKNMIFGDLYAAKKSMNSIARLRNDDYVEFAQVLVTSGKYVQANEKLHDIKHNILTTLGPKSSQLLPVLNNLAVMQAQQGEFGEASQNALDATNISKNTFGNESYQYAKASFVNGLVASYFGDYNNASFEFKKAKYIYNTVFGEKNIMYAKSLSEYSLARLYNGEQAEDLESGFKKSTEIIINTIGYNTFESANALKNNAFYELEKGDILDAEDYITQSIEILTELGENEYKLILAENHRINAKIQQYNKEYKKSELSYKKALGLYVDQFSNKDHLEITLTRSSLAQLYYIQGERKDSKKELNATTEVYLNYINKYFNYLTEREKKEFWKKINSDFEFYKTLAFESNNKREIEKVYNNTLSTKAILLSSSKKLREAIFTSDDGDVKKLFNDWSRKRGVLTHALSMNDQQLIENNIDIEQLQKEIDKIEKTLGSKSNAFINNKEKEIRWKDVRDRLKENEYAVEIIRYHEFDEHFTDKVIYKALVLGNDFTSPKVIDFKPGNDLDTKYLNYYRNTTKFRRPDKISFKAFYQPIYDMVGENATVYISLEGAYNLINLEALRMPDNSYVIDKNDIVIVSSTKDLVTKENQSYGVNTKKKMLTMANPMYYEENLNSENHENINPNQTIKQLPGAEKEGFTVDSIFRNDNWVTDIYTWDKADENVIKKIGKTEASTYSYVHIATHGFFHKSKIKNTLASSLDSRRGMDDPYLRSGLLFTNGGDVLQNNSVMNFNIADGVLTAKEVSTLDLKGVDIVVLSACETGLGDIASGEGVYGLQRAFLAAGVKIVVLSLFKVDDAVTNLLMEKLSTKFTETNNIRESLTYAKHEVQKKYPEPIYWGSFTMVY